MYLICFILDDALIPFYNISKYSIGSFHETA